MPSEYFMPDPRFSIDGLYPSIGLGKTYGEIRKTFTNLREQLHSKVKGFGDMTAIIRREESVRWILPKPMSTNISCFQRTTRQKDL